MKRIYIKIHTEKDILQLHMKRIYIKIHTEKDILQLHTAKTSLLLQESTFSCFVDSSGIPFFLQTL